MESGSCGALVLVNEPETVAPFDSDHSRVGLRRRRGQPLGGERSKWPALRPQS
jgi:hypothetical protein